MSDDLKWQRRSKLLIERYKEQKEREQKEKEEQEAEEKKITLFDSIEAERELFDAVRSYIRENDVNEFMVAKEFDIPVSKVKSWIREGRIEYKEGGSTVFVGGSTCYNCGKKIDFGSLCTKCKRLMDGGEKMGFAVQKPGGETGKMRSHLRSDLD